MNTDDVAKGEDTNKRWAQLAQRLTALYGATGVAAAAYGAHGVEKWATEQGISWWQKAASFHLLGAVFLFVLTPLYLQGRVSRLSLPLFGVGTLIFSGTLYAMTLGGPKILGAITPIGGACLILGFISLWKKPKHSL